MDNRKEAATKEEIEGISKMQEEREKKEPKNKVRKSKKEIAKNDLKGLIIFRARKVTKQFPIELVLRKMNFKDWGK